MKQNIHKIAIALLSLSALVIQSCDDYLREKPLSFQDLDGFVTDGKSLDILLVGVYGRLQSCYVPATAGLGNVGTDEAECTKSNDNTMPLDNYTLTTSSNAPKVFWANYFVVIRDANIVLDKAQSLSDDVISPTDRIRIIAEARFLRGYAYFQLLRTFGEVPIFENMIKQIGPDQHKIGRNSINEVFHFIEQDFQYGILQGLTPNKNGGRPTTWAAKALLAKLYLYVGSSKHRNEVGTPKGGYYADSNANSAPPMQATLVPIEGGKKNLIPGYNSVQESYTELYKKANTLLKDIIDNGGFSLTNNYYDPFVAANKNVNKESLWEIQFSSTTGYGGNWSKQFGVRGANGDANVSAVCGSQIIQPVPGFFNYYREGDLRRDLYFYRYIMSYSPTWEPSQSTLFTYTTAMNFINPANFSTVAVSVPADLTALNDTLLYAAHYNIQVNLQIGTGKYGWGATPDMTQWWTELMSYTATDCPNNVIVMRYADVLLMYAETDMLINGGADPSRPQALGCATDEAIKSVNKLIERAMGYQSHESLVETCRLQLKADSTTLEAEWIAKNNAYNANKTNGNFSAYVLANAKLQSVKKKLATIDNYIVNLYDKSTFTYEMLIDERSRELCFEFQRWYDLQRLGWLKYKYCQRKRDYKTTSPMGQLEEPKHYLYPIPLNDIDLSLNYDFKENNPGYGD